MSVIFLALLIFHLLLLAVEVDRRFVVMHAVFRQRGDKIRSEEDEIVQYRDKRQKVKRELGKGVSGDCDNALKHEMRGISWVVSMAYTKNAASR